VYFGEERQRELKEGISKMAAWAKVVGSRASAEFENIEIEENLPQGWNKKAVKA
jgi:UDP-glucose 4-epimerase